MITDRKIINYQKAKQVSQRIKRAGKKIVLATGCFDIPHIGHLVYLSFCKSKGDILFVSVGNDRTVKQLKGERRPILNENYRARTIAGYQVVDYVVISEEYGKMDHNILTQILKPDVYVVPANDSAVREKEELILKNDGKFIIYHRNKNKKSLDSVSTTSLEKKLFEKSKI
jgi:D-beta-D-heptose 7-phosphate kinase/D-beta-D-heptose 1-phosphate adenosyltransferase